MGDVEALYLYAASRNVSTGDLAGVRGIDGQPVHTVGRDGLVAVVSPVSLDDFDEDGLRRNLERLDWLEQVARAHDSVVHAVSLVGPTAPLRLATVCLGEDGVQRRLDQWAEQLEGALDRVDGRAEWSVKAFSARSIDDAEAQTPSPDLTGAEYLRHRKVELAARTRAADEARRGGEHVHEGLKPYAVASRLLAPQDPRLTGDRREMVLNAAYLVDSTSADRFTAQVEQLAAGPGVEIEFAGPWPPYSFVELEEQ